MGGSAESSLRPGVDLTCSICSAQAIGHCAACGKRHCHGHQLTHRCSLEAIVANTVAAAIIGQRVEIARVGDFSIEKMIVGEQGERRYFCVGPDDAANGISLGNLEAIGRLIDEALAGER